MAVERTLAGHIRKLFEAASSTDGPRVIDAWAKVFNRSVNESGLLEAVNTIALGLDQLTAAVGGSAFDDTLKAQSETNIGQLRQFVTFPLLYEAGPQNMRDPTVSAAISNIILLEAIAGEPLNRVIPENYIADFQQKVVTLLAEVDALPVPPQVIALLKENLSRIVWALGSYDLLGVEGLSRIFGSATSEIFRSAPEVAKSAQGRAFMGKAVKVTKAIATAIIVIGGLAQGTETITDMADHARMLLTVESE
jgi:hypothetical protein